MDVAKISMPPQVEPSSQPVLRGVRPRQETASSPQVGQASQPISREDLEAAMASLSVHTNLKVELSHDEKTGSEVVRIFSEDGKRLLRQIPSEAVLNIAENLEQKGKGGLLGSLV
ncbi:MAG: flagellar protein FlaG [Pseudomonadota bacterium]